MKTYLISYDLNQPRKETDYPQLIAAIKQLGTWWHCLDSTWIVKSNLSAAQIRDALKPHLDNGDELLVASLTGESAWFGFDAQCSSWLKTNIQP